MSYTTRNFEDGDVLFAASLNEMDEQILANTLGLEEAVETDKLTAALQSQTDQLVEAIQSLVDIGISGGGGSVEGGTVTVTIGSVTTLPAGSNATVTNSGTNTNVILNFGIPRGADGAGGTGGGTTVDLTEAKQYTDQKVGEVANNLASHTHDALTYVNQDVRTTASPTFNVVTANKVIGAVYA